jgi:O-antigen/teichoic acid export membrane protein
MVEQPQVNPVVTLYRRFESDRLLSNSIYLMLATFVMSVTGFVFWIINTKFHTPFEIGLATTFISVTGLISSLSMFGLNIALVRFLPKENEKKELVNTVFTLLVMISAAITSVFLVGIHFFSEPMSTMLYGPLRYLLFLLFVPLATVNMITDSVFISHGKAVYTFFINTLMSLLKLLLTILLMRYGLMGIVLAYVGSTVFALVASLGVMHFVLQYRFLLQINVSLLKNMWKFSFGNYMSSLLGTITSMVMPVLITSKLSAETTAYYYMPTMIIALLQAVPRSAVSSLVAEGAREEERLSKLVVKSFLHSYALLIPAAAAIFILGNFILSAFGKSYSSEGLGYLRILVFAILIAVPGYIAGAILNIKKMIRAQFFINCFGAVLGLSLNLYLLRYGLIGLGAASIISQIIVNSIYGVVLLRKR